MEYFEATLQNLQRLALFEAILPQCLIDLVILHRLFFVLCILRTKCKTMRMHMQLIAGLLFSLSFEACG